MNRYIINGGAPLNGTLIADSAKNAVLPILAACILHNGVVTLHNVTPIKDVVNMLKLLKVIGCQHTFSQDGTLTLDLKSIDSWVIPHDIARELRSSIFVLGPILSRFGEAKVSYPGGCDIGLRPIDLHLKGLEKLGARIHEEDGYIVCDGNHMHSGIVHLDYPSVGATENVMMAAVRLRGRTIISNAAKEPEIEDLQNFIVAMGGHVYGAGTDTLIIDGVNTLHDTDYTPMPDRIIAGTYLIAAAISGGSITVNDTRPNDLRALISKLQESGCTLDVGDNYIHLTAPKRPLACQEIQTLPHPGFATDLQAQMTALQSISEGTCMVIENLFETRYKYVPELIKMGANITVRNRCAIVRGVERLHGTSISALDLRGGAALVLAGLRAQGKTIVDNAEIVERGYYKLEERLRSVGADVTLDSTE